jgi:N-acetyl sugar amidotransferase
MKSNYSLFSAPEEIIFCKKCVISNQRPNSTVEFQSKDTFNKETINFNSDGICSACEFNEIKENKINWKNRKKRLEDICNKHRKKNGYDVIVPSSGGKDSGYVAHMLKNEYDMNPLTVTWAPHRYTQIGWKNLQDFINIGGFNNILFTPNGKLHRKLTSLAFKNLLHPFQPFIIGQKSLGPLMALKFDIPLVMYGENNGEYGNNIDDNFLPQMDKVFFSNQDIDKIYLCGKSISSLIEETEFKINDFAPYIPPKLEDLDKKKIEVHYFSYYKKWDPQESYYYAYTNTGFKPNTERTSGSYSKYSSIDDKIDDFHYFTTYIKFGIGRSTYDAAQEVRCGKITREEAVNLVKKYDNEFPEKYFKDFLDYIDMEINEFWQIIDKHRSPHLWEKNGNEWKIKHTVY